MFMKNIIDLQRAFYNTGATLDVEYRKKQLIIIRGLVHQYRPEIIEAFKRDYNKCEFDVYSTEIGMVLHELNYLINNIGRLSKPKRKCTSSINFPSKGYIMPEPYGVVLVVAPWNYPFNLSILPLAGAISAGNTVILKLSINTPNVSSVVSKMLSGFPKELIYTTYDNPKEREELFDQKYDYIFYTGSVEVARKMMIRQAENIVPVTLELGGKSPCIIDADADIDKSARRVVWGKYLNAGQTCVAPDFVFLNSAIKGKWIERAQYYIKKFYYDNENLSDDFPYVVNERHVERLLSLCINKKVICGGRAKGRLMEPTILEDVTFEDQVMKEEIFGPVMPVLDFSDINEVMGQLKKMEKPLALYFFGRKNAKKVMNTCSYGGGCVNDTIMHLTEPGMPFGGIGASGMGYYHGKKSFETFSHNKSVLNKSIRLELNLKYNPYTKRKLRMIKIFFGIK